MNRSTNMWSTAVAAAALFALPVAASAQTPPTTQPPTQPTTQPTTTQQPPSEPASAQPNQSAAKQHLTAARESLSQLTSLPEAAKLQGEARTQVSQLITNFNELITTQANWRASFDKVNANVTALLGPEGADPAATGTAGAVGTSGSAAATPAAPAEIDPAVRAKLVDFRTHLKAFEQAAVAAQPAAASETMPPSAATGSTSNPANPAQATQPPPPASATGAGVSGATGTSGATPAADQSKATEQAGHAEADKHLDAIWAILEQSEAGPLTKAQTAELKMHVAEVRKLLKQPK